jgi:glyceraldehyde 3-phosphate dehydrogenase
MRIGINGFGRIGKNYLKALIERYPDHEVVAINDLSPAKDCAHLFKYDSNYGPYPSPVSSTGEMLHVGDRAIHIVAHKNPHELPWKKLGVDLVIECTGRFTDGVAARGHLAAGAQKVIISAPAKGEDLTVCMGVNDEDYKPDQHHIISNASCTTNCLAASLSPIVQAYGWRRGFMTTIHSYTNDQNILDAPHQDMRRARAAATNIIPTSSGAAKALYLTIPEVQGSFDGFALRVPTATVSMCYLVAHVQKETDRAAISKVITQAAASGPLRGILGHTSEDVVSSDLKRSPLSAIVDMQLTQCMGDLLQLCVWYDNEWGYASRLADLTHKIIARAATK